MARKNSFKSNAAQFKEAVTEMLQDGGALRVKDLYKLFRDHVGIPPRKDLMLNNLPKGAVIIIRGNESLVALPSDNVLEVIEDMMLLGIRPAVCQSIKDIIFGKPATNVVQFPQAHLLKAKRAKAG